MSLYIFMMITMMMVMVMTMMTMGGCSNLWSSAGPPSGEEGSSQPPSHPSLREDNDHKDADDHHDNHGDGDPDDDNHDDGDDNKNLSDDNNGSLLEFIAVS